MGGSQAVWNFSENSSVLVWPPVSIWLVALSFADETNDLRDSRFCGPLHKILKMGVPVFGFGLNLVFVPSENVSLSRMQDGKDHQSQ